MKENANHFLEIVCVQCETRSFISLGGGRVLDLLGAASLGQIRHSHGCMRRVKLEEKILYYYLFVFLL